MPAYTDQFLPVAGGVTDRKTGEFYPYYPISFRDVSDPNYGTLINPVLPRGAYFVHTVSLDFGCSSEHIGIGSSRYLTALSTDMVQYDVLASVGLPTPPGAGTPPPDGYIYGSSNFFHLDSVCHVEWGLLVTAVNGTLEDSVCGTLVVANLPEY